MALLPAMAGCRKESAPQPARERSADAGAASRPAGETETRPGEPAGAAQGDHADARPATTKPDERSTTRPGEACDGASIVKNSDDDAPAFQSHFGPAANSVSAASSPGEAAASRPADEIDLLLAEGAAALRAGDPPRAAELFHRAFQRDPGRGGPLRGLAETHILSGQYAQAADVYEMLLHLEPDDAVARFNRAVVLSRVRRFAEAEDAYRRLLDCEPRAVQARYNLASLYHAQGKLADARRQWLIVVDETPQLASAHAALGEAHLQLGDAAAAMAAYAEAAKLSPDDAGAWANLATAARAAGSGGREAAALERATALARHDAELWARLADAQLRLHRQSGRRELLTAAVASWKRCAELDDSRQDVKDWIATYEPLVNAGPSQAQ